MPNCDAGEFKTTDRLLDEFLRLKCAPDILATGVFPNAKELSESMGAFESLRRALFGIDRDDLLRDSDIVLYDVGAGRKPRSAVLAAFRSRWSCVAIDPVIDPQAQNIRKIRRVEVFSGKVEDYQVKPEDAGKFAIVFSVHNHATLSATMEALQLDKRPGYGMISIPCCVPHDVPMEWDEVRDDWGIKSGRRTVYRKVVWPDKVLQQAQEMALQAQEQEIAQEEEA